MEHYQYDAAPTQSSVPLYRDTAALQADLMLSPDIPQNQRKYFEKIYMIISRLSALSYLEREDILEIIISFRLICIYLELGLDEDARKIISEIILKLQLSRSIGGFQTLFGQQGIQRTEHVERVVSRARKTRSGGGLRSKIAGIFRGGNQQETSGDMRAGVFEP